MVSRRLGSSNYKCRFKIISVENPGKNSNSRAALPRAQVGPAGDEPQNGKYPKVLDTTDGVKAFDNIASPPSIANQQLRTSFSWRRKTNSQQSRVRSEPFRS